VATCSACGQENRAEARFCDSCGAALTAAEPTRELRKVVTIVFCDVTGSTALGERLDSESLRKVMGRYFDVAREVLERHGGNVEKFIGDAVMAVFGVPVVHEDDALRAVRSAFELRDRLDAVNSQLREGFGVELSVRIGINTGEVVTSGGGTLATGDAVNVAARLEQAARPGEILVGERTRQLAEGALELEPVAPIEAKGKSDPLTAYRLVTVREDAPAFVRRFDAPFVGRTVELAHLEQAYERAARDRACHLFTVLGPAGIGKSRLTYEFLFRRTNAAVLRGRCLAYGEGITYFPLVEILEAIAADTDVSAFVSRDPEAQRTVNQVASAVGLADEPALSREETFHAVRRLFEAIARGRPLVLVFDDIHWAEPTFLDLVDHLVDWSRGASIFVLCMARPELLDSRPAWGGGKLNTTTTLLEPLSDDESDALMDNLLVDASISDDLRQRIAATAEGNPLFVEQMLALIVEDGADGALEVPPTIQALLAARLEQLPTVERVAIERAAVVGKEFWRTALVELGGEPSALPPLVRKELIRPHSSLLFPAEEAFRFRHLLIRDAAYDGMPKELRAELHERFARWLDQHRSEYDEIVGYHFEQAYRLREELGPLDERARDLGLAAGRLLGRAGQRAYDRGDLPAAVNLLRRATSLVPSTERGRLGWLVQLGYALKDVGELDRSAEAYAAAIDDAERLGETAVAARARIGLLRTASQTGGAADADAVERDLRVLEAVGDEYGLAEGLAVLATFQAWAGHSAPAAAAFERSRRLALQSGSRRLANVSFGFQTMLEAWGHLPADEGLRRCDELLPHHLGTEAEGFLRSARGNYLSLLGEEGQARREVERAREIAREFGYGLQAAGGAMSFADQALRAGRPEEAEAAARDGLAELEALGELGYASTVAALLAQTLYLQGRYDEAEQTAQHVRDISAVEDFDPQVRWRSVQAKVLARRGAFEQADALSGEAVAIAEETDWYRFHADALADRAEVLELAGRRADAATALRTALELYERKQARVDARRTRERLERLAKPP
jgi:class 3 adenylate cyclase/tetratricopeptide (TPR) repeat protein